MTVYSAIRIRRETGALSKFSRRFSFGLRITHHALRIAHHASRITHYAFLLALFLTLSSPAAPASQAEPPLLIGLLLPPEEATAASLRQGAQLGLDHANELPGPKANLIVRGRPGQWGDDGVEAARMVLDDGASALIAPRGGAASHLSLQVAGRTAIPVVSLCGDSSVTGAGIPWMVRIAARTTEEARAIFAATPAPPTLPSPALSPREGRRLSAPLRPMRWTALVPPARPGREATRDLAEAARLAGCLLLQPIEVTTNLADTATLANHALACRPEGILLWLDPLPAGRFARALRAAGYHGKLAGPGSLQSGDFLKNAGDASEGFLVPAIVLDEASRAAFVRFISAYRAHYQSESDPSAALAYDATRLLVSVLRKAGSETPRRAFPLVETPPGATGVLSFDKEGNRKVNLNLLVWQNGKFTISTSTR